MNLFLIGYRGTGKTTVAQLLAARLGWSWLDADVELEQRAGRSIAEIFAADGEPAFRELESAVLKDLLEQDQTVHALGGGVVLRPENRKRLQEAIINRGAQVIWLTANAGTLHQRISDDATTTLRRPGLTSLDGLAEVEHLLQVREPFYRETASLIVETADKTPEQIVEEIVRQLAAIA